MTKNSTLKEDGILGYDVIGKRAILDGPNKTILINSGKSYVEFPLTGLHNQSTINTINQEEQKEEEEKEIKSFHQIYYLNNAEINPQYAANLARVRSITQEINQSKIKISATNNVFSK